MYSVGGYPKGQTFGCVIGERHSSGRQDYLDYHNAAVTIPGPAITRIEKIARESGVLIVSGVIEKEKVGGSLFCTVVWVHPEGGLIGKRRKVSCSGLRNLFLSFAKLIPESTAHTDRLRTTRLGTRRRL